MQGKDTTIAVNQLSLTMPEGEITILLGRNGAGKTTMMSMIEGRQMCFFLVYPYI